MARLLPRDEVLHRLRAVRAMAEGGVGLLAAARALGISHATLGRFLGRHMNYLAWPPALAEVDGALERVTAGQKTLPPRAPRPVRVLPVLQPMVQAAASVYDVAPALVLATCRLRPVVRARQAVIWALFEARPDLSYSQVSTHVGLADHSTVIHHRRLAERLRQMDPVFIRASDLALAAALHPAVDPVILPAVAEALAAQSHAREQARVAARVARALDDCAVDEVEAGVALLAEAQANPAAAEIFRQRRALPRDAGIEGGSRRLLEALCRAHPERCAAAGVAA